MLWGWLFLEIIIVIVIIIIIADNKMIIIIIIVVVSLPSLTDQVHQIGFYPAIYYFTCASAFLACHWKML